MEKYANDPYVDSPVVLKIPPKKCAACGGKFIPHGRNTIYCPECRKLPQKRREAMKAEREKMDPQSDPGEVRAYVDPALVRKKEKAMKTEKKDKNERPSVPEGWQEEQKAISDPEEADRQDGFAEDLIRLAEKAIGGRLIRGSDLVPMSMTIGNKKFDGFFVKRKSAGGLMDD